MEQVGTSNPIASSTKAKRAFYAVFLDGSQPASALGFRGPGMLVQEVLVLADIVLVGLAVGVEVLESRLSLLSIVTG